MIRKLRMPGSPEFFTEVRAYMKREKINQTELAQRMGVDQSTVSRMMRGQTSPSVDTLDKLAAVMNKEVAELLYKYLGRPLPPIYEMVSRVGAYWDDPEARKVAQQHAELIASAPTLKAENEQLKAEIERLNKKLRRVRQALDEERGFGDYMVEKYAQS